MPKKHLALLFPYANLLACFMKVKVGFSGMTAEVWSDYGEWCQWQTSRTN